MTDVGAPKWGRYFISSARVRAVTFPASFASGRVRITFAWDEKITDVGAPKWGIYPFSFAPALKN